MKLIRLYLAIIAFVCTLSPAQASAQVLDCSKAHRAYDKHICSHPDLLKSYRKIEDLFEKNLEKLSASARKDFIRGQKEWLVYAKMSFKESSSNTVAILSNRITELKKSVVPIKGGPVLYLHQRYNTARDFFLYDYSSFYLIDTPVNNTEKTWNARNAAEDTTADNDPDCQNINTETVNFANKDMISISRNGYMQCKGSHGYPEHEIVYYQIPSMRIFNPKDIFAPSSHWLSFITKKTYTQLQTLKTDNKNQSRVFDDSVNDLKDEIGRLAEWMISEKGVTVVLSPQCAVCIEPAMAPISWDVLKPYLKDPIARGVPATFTEH